MYAINCIKKGILISYEKFKSLLTLENKTEKIEVKIQYKGTTVINNKLKYIYNFEDSENKFSYTFRSDNYITKSNNIFSDNEENIITESIITEVVLYYEKMIFSKNKAEDLEIIKLLDIVFGEEFDYFIYKIRIPLFDYETSVDENNCDKEGILLEKYEKYCKLIS